MEPRAVTAGQGWQWIVEGYRLFMRNALIWITLTIVMALIWLLSLALPLLGPLLFNLMSPVLLGGIMLGCRATEQGEELELAHLFSAFRSHATPLVTIGGVHLVGSLIILMLVMGTAGGSMMTAMPGKSPADLDAAMKAMSGMMGAILLGMALYMPLMMAIWFAPPLIVFRNIEPVPALKLSFVACWTNTLPFTLYGLALLVLWVIASIPLLLGLVVLLPVLFCSVYTSYKDIFQENVKIDAPAV